MKFEGVVSWRGALLSVERNKAVANVCLELLVGVARPVIIEGTEVHSNLLVFSESGLRRNCAARENDLSEVED